MSSLSNHIIALGSRIKASSDLRRGLIFILILLLLAVAGLGIRPLWEPDEGRYVGVALEMLRLDDWMTPMLNPETPHFTKPPLTYWLIASSISAFGQTEFAARVPGAVAYFATTLLVWYMGKFFVRSNRMLPAVVFATSLFPFIASSIITTDMILTFWETLAVCGFVRLWLGGKSDGSIMMWCGFGFAFLTKGPPGLLPFIALIIFVAVRRPISFRRLISVTGILLFLIIAFGWYGAQLLIRPDLFSYLISSEVVGRIATPMHHRNNRFWGWLIYLPVIALAMLPWAAVLFYRRQRQSMIGTDEKRFPLWWIAVPLLIFFVVPSRLPLYLVPLTVPAALLITSHLPSDLLARRSARAALGLWIMALLILRFASALYSYEGNPRPLASWIRESMGHAPNEVIFINMKPFYGLIFYLGAGVEKAEVTGSLDALTHYRPLTEPLREEISEKGIDETVYVVPERFKSNFEGVLRDAGYNAKELSSWHGLILYDDPRKGR